MIHVKIPASTANLGPGFDVLGAGLSLYLELKAELAEVTTIFYSGDSPELISLNPEKNLLTNIMQYIANCFKRNLPTFTLWIVNPIPLGRGLGSSGSAIVAAIAMANELMDLKMGKNEIMDYATIVEGHPDNVGGSIYGWNISYLRCSLPTWQDDWCKPGCSTVETPSTILQRENVVGSNLVCSHPFAINKNIKCVVVIPEFHVPTALARKVLPTHHSRNDCVFNMGRLASLFFALSAQPVNHTTIYECMQDRIHQNYRAHLVKGLEQILNLTPKNFPGLAGVCLSGAGPTVLVLATDNLEAIGAHIVSIFENEKVDGKPIKSRFQILEFEDKGIVVCNEN